MYQFSGKSETVTSSIGLLRAKGLVFDLGYLDQIQHIVTGYLILV
jgi:hypothetical protein